MARLVPAVATLAALGLAAPAWAQAAPKAYATNCQLCHKPDGKGTPGVFPRLTGRVDAIAAHKDGRKWLIATVLYGQSGAITVDGKPVRGTMGPFARLSDKDIADTLNWLAQGKGRAFTPAEVAAVRGEPGWTLAKVGEMRKKLAGAGVIK
ncbi:c-type cytochrome [Novosphingobium album (ex Liu et al. 2023)]|nr:cytochrome c [Novosphingobium album (ex Liu et al. 2023)]